MEQWSIEFLTFYKPPSYGILIRGENLMTNDGANILFI